MITLPLNRASESRMSFNDQSSASKTYMLIMGVSSQISAFVVFISFARSNCLLIEQNESASTLIGILNRECAVLPPIIMLLLYQRRL